MPSETIELVPTEEMRKIIFFFEINLSYRWTREEVWEKATSHGIWEDQEV